MPRRLEVEVVADPKGYKRGLDSASKSSDGFAASLKSMGKTAGLAAGAVGLGAIVVGLKSSLGAAKDAEQAQARLEDALKSANVSYAKHGEAIDSAIQKTSRLAALDDEDLSDAFAKLVRSTGDVTKATEGMALAADIARARNISLESATKTVEKGLLGQEAAFRRVGVEITKGMTASEAFAKAQEQFAGAAERHGQTAAGSQERLAVAFENLQEKIGQKLIPIFARLMEILLQAVVWTEENWPKFEAVFERSVEVVKAVIDELRPVFEGIIQVIEGIIQIVRGLIEGDWSMVWEGLKNVVGGALSAVVGLIKATWGNALAAAKTLGLKILDGIKDGLLDLAKLVKDKFVDAIQAYVGLYGRAGEAAFDLGRRILSAIGNGIGNLAGAVKEKFMDGIDAIRNLAAAAAAAARAVGTGILNAITGALSGLKDALLAIFKGAINAVIRGINSIKLPSVSIRIPVPFGRDINFSTPAIDPIPDIPELAKGGIVRRPTLAMIGEKGPEAVVPLGRGAAAAGGAGTFVFNFPNYVGSKQELQQAMKDAVADWGRRNGGSFFGGRA